MIIAFEQKSEFVWLILSTAICSILKGCAHIQPGYCNISFFCFYFNFVGCYITLKVELFIIVSFLHHKKYYFSIFKRFCFKIY